MIVIAAISPLHAARAGDEPRQNSVASEVFLVSDANGPFLLDARGQEIRRLDSRSNGSAAFSPDGDWVAYSDARREKPGGPWKGELIVESRVDPEHGSTLPLVWGTSGSSELFLWSSDSKRILICEQGWRDKVRESAYRIYDLTKKEMAEVDPQPKQWPCDWSGDGKRFLNHDNGRIVWVSFDGADEPEFITRELEVAYGARLSPDSSRILCLAGLRRPNEADRRLRLSVVDLQTRKRTIVDEPGDVQTYSYCWSADGARIAYTWQKSFDRRADTARRETFLMTCTRDGTEREMITSRSMELGENDSGRNGVVFFFKVHSWR